MSRSYTPSPPRGYGRRGRSSSSRGHYGGRGKDMPTSLLVRNLRHDCRAEDLRWRFGQFGPLKDIYLPRDYYTGEPRGFGFVQGRRGPFHPEIGAPTERGHTPSLLQTSGLGVVGALKIVRLSQWAAKDGLSISE